MTHAEFQKLIKTMTLAERAELARKKRNPSASLVPFEKKGTFTKE